MPKERIKLENKFEATCVSCKMNKYKHCDKYNCMNYGVCAMCKNYTNYYDECEKQCLYFNHHKAFPTTDMSNVEFILNPTVKEYIKSNYKPYYNLSEEE